MPDFRYATFLESHPRERSPDMDYRIRHGQDDGFAGPVRRERRRRTTYVARASQGGGLCEVLENVEGFANTAVAVVGPMERSVSVIDRYKFLSQYRCEHPIITHGHTFSNRIEIWTGWEQGIPKPPADKPKLDRAVVAENSLLFAKGLLWVPTKSHDSTQTAA